MSKYISAYDPVTKHRVLFRVIKGYAISLVSGYKFKYDNKKKVKK
jgi:hypothetical protein